MLPTLKKLDVSDNTLQGHIPPTFGTSPALKYAALRLFACVSVCINDAACVRVVVSAGRSGSEATT